MEVRHPLLTSDELAGLLGGRPQTVEQVLRADRLEARLGGRAVTPNGQASTQATVEGRTRATRTLRRLIAGALHVAADALYPSGTR